MDTSYQQTRAIALCHVIRGIHEKTNKRIVKATRFPNYKQFCGRVSFFFFFSLLKETVTDATRLSNFPVQPREVGSPASYAPIK